MWKSILSLLVLSAFLMAGIIFLLPKVSPDYSRQGKQVLINGIDTAVIVNEEQARPEWANWSWIPKRPQNINVRYKDKMGIYHEESFAKNEITELETQ